MSLAEIASQLVEVIAKLQFLALQLEKASKEQKKPGWSAAPSSS